MQNFTQNFTLSNPVPSAAGNWDADIWFYPHPYLFGAVRTVDSDGHVMWSGLQNGQIAGATAGEKATTFIGMCERYRLAYMGVTGFHNASAIANNGMVTVAQYMETPMYATIDLADLTPTTQLKAKAAASAAGSDDLTICERFVRPAEAWYNAPRSMEQLRMMPNSYTGNAREGVYVPFRLSNTHQVWQSGSDTQAHLNYQAASLLDGNYYHAASPVTADYPYGLESPSTSSWGKFLLHRRSDTGVVHIALRQLAQDAAFEFVMRCGWEMQVLPGSPLCSFAKSSPQYDPTAIKLYFQLSREFKDAYPAEYNDLGKILGVIGKGLKVIAGAAFPVLTPVLDALGGGPAPRDRRHLMRRQQPMGVTEQSPNLMSAATAERIQRRADAELLLERSDPRRQGRRPSPRQRHPPPSTNQGRRQLNISRRLRN